jgi:hypothetical protein
VSPKAVAEAAAPSAIDLAAEQVAKLKAAFTGIHKRRAEAIRTQDVLDARLPEAQAAADLAQADGDPSLADDILTKLKMERNNVASVLRGCDLREGQLTRELAAAESTLARARAHAALPPMATAEMAQESLEEGFDHLGELIVNGVRQALATLPRDDHRGVTDAFDEAQLAKWVWSQCAQAGLDLNKARHVQYGSGTGPVETLANVRAVMETL